MYVVSCGLETFTVHFRAAADEMQECSASIVLKYLQVKSGIYKLKGIYV